MDSRDVPRLGRSKEVVAAIHDARKILKALSGAGFQAYMVGGAVRDMLMGISHLDIDICTDATPEQIIAVAAERGWKSSEVGAAFGSVIVVVNGQGYDVTSFRREEYGEDCHKPERVEFGASLKEDLARRDFTINTLCFDSTGDLIDLFGGLEDLRLGIIRAVGDPNVRFAEDGLRMFRAARFVAQFGFTLDKAILPAIVANSHRIRGLSVERVRKELERTLQGKYASRGLNILMTAGMLSEVCRDKENKQDGLVPILPEAAHLFQLPQNPKHHRLDAWRHTLSAVDNIPPDRTLRWAALLHDIAKGEPGIRGINEKGELTDYHHDVRGADMAAAILKRLKVDKAVVERVVWLVRHHMHSPAPNSQAIIRWLRRRASSFADQQQLTEAMEQLFHLYEADGMATRNLPNYAAQRLATLVWPVLERVPFYPSALAIRGGEIAAVLGDGPQVTHFQRSLLQRVQSGALANTHSELLTALQARERRISAAESPCHCGDIPL